MKKLALIIALVLVACFAFVACSPSNEGNQNPPASSEQGSTGSEGTNPPASSEQGTNPPASSNQGTVVTPPPAGSEIWLNVADVVPADKALNVEYTENQTVGGVEFVITRGKLKDSKGKTVTEGTKSGTSFTRAYQLGKNGTADDKSIKFTVPAGCTSVEIYVNSGSSGTDGTFVVAINGTAADKDCKNANVTCVTVAVAAGDQVALYGNSTVSANIWGILIK